MKYQERAKSVIAGMSVWLPWMDKKKRKPHKHDTRTPEERGWDSAVLTCGELTRRLMDWDEDMSLAIHQVWHHPSGPQSPGGIMSDWTPELEAERKAMVAELYAESAAEEKAKLQALLDSAVAAERARCLGWCKKNLGILEGLRAEGGRKWNEELDIRAREIHAIVRDIESGKDVP
jgi:hypothetical protein